MLGVKEDGAIYNGMWAMTLPSRRPMLVVCCLWQRLLHGYEPVCGE
ncbi:MAG: hypothetical protein SCJ97_08975 [Bacillota bacterium]|nr:hypothetical protein [Bacillota bacterium]